MKKYKRANYGLFLKKAIKRLRLRTWIALGMLAVILPVIVLSLFHSQSADAAWFNDSWAYRKKVPITAHTGAETSKYFSVTVDSSDTTKFQADCGDIRFTDNTGMLLQYYIASGCSSASTVIHVLVPTFPAGATDYYMYYGNPTAVNGFSSADFTAGTSVTVGSVGSEEKGALPITYWNLDEGNGSTSLDSSPNANNASLISTVWQPEQMCVVGKCEYFTGTGALTANGSALEASTITPYAQLTQGSISFWAKVQNNNSYEDIFTIARGADTTSTQLEIFYDNTVSGGLNFGASIDVDGTTQWAFNVASSNFNAITETNRWHHYIVTHNGTTPELYIDGQSVPITFTTSTNKTKWLKAIITDATSKADGLRVGHDYVNSTVFNPLKGFVDDIKIYNYSLSAAQAAANYTSRGSLDVASVSQYAGIPGSISSGLVGYWKMDESSANTCSGGANDNCDSSGNVLDGAWKGNATTTSNGKFGAGVTYDGTGDYVEVTDPSSGILDFGSTGSFTLSSWVYHTTTNLIECYFNKQLTGTSAGYRFCKNDNAGSGGLFFRIDDGTNSVQINGSTSLSTATWYFVSVVVNRTTQTAKVFVNGVEDGSASISTVGSVDNATNLRMGRSQSSFDMSGRQDEARIYNRALSAQEISQLYSFAPGPLGYWKLDEPKGATSVYDSSSNELTGTINNPSGAPITAGNTGKFGSALSFPSNNQDSVGITYATLDNMPRYTFSAWVKPSAATGDIVAKSEYLFGLSTASKNVVFSRNFSTSNLTVLSANNSYVDNVWQHVTVTWDGTTAATGVHMYVNGVETTYSTQTSGVGTATEDDARGMSIGSDFAGNGNNPFSGLIDEVRVYNYVRTQSQILEDMNGGHPLAGSPVGSQLVYWKMDEQNGNTINNSGNGGSTYNGTNSGAAWLTKSTCKVNGCLNVDTSTDTVSIADANMGWIDSLTGFSTSFWINPPTLSSMTTKSILAKITTSTASNSFAIVTDTSSAAEIRVYIASTTTDTSNYFLTSNLGLTAGTWQHITVVYDGTQAAANRVRVYKNGRLVSGSVSGTIPTAMTSGSTSNLILGDDQGSTYTAFLAYYDELKVYNTALTGDQVKIEAQYGSGIDFGTGQNEATQITGSAETGPILYAPLDENTGTTAKDITGNGRDGTLRSTAKYVTGKIGTGVAFDGTNGGTTATASHISFTDDILDSLTTESTFETWLKINSTGTDDWQNFIGLVEEGGTKTGKYLEIAYERSTSKVWFYSGWTSDCATEIRASVVLPGSQTAWHHFAFTLSTSGNAMYIDGVKQALTYTLGTSSTSCNLTNWATGGGGTTKLTLGCWFQSTVCYNNEMYEGALDDFKVYNYARTPAQIAYDYNRGGPLGWWKLDECQGSTVYDASGNSLNGTISIGGTGTQTAVGTCATSSTAWGNGAVGKFNNSINFDGTDDKITLTDNALFDLNTTGFYSVSAWVKPSSIGGTGNLIFDSGSSSTTTFSVEAVTTADTDFGPVTNGVAAYWLSSWGTNGLIAHTKNNVLSTGTWAFVTATYDGSQSQANRLKIYVNGVDQTDTTDIRSVGTIANISPTTTTIGSDIANEYFAGQIDEVRFYNYALSSSQVRKLFNNGSSVYFGPVQGTPIP